MKVNKYLVLVCLLIFSVSLVGCGKKNENEESNSLNTVENEESTTQVVRQYSEDELYGSLNSEKLKEIGLMEDFIFPESFITFRPRENDELLKQYNPLGKDRYFVKKWMKFNHNLADNTVNIKTYYNEHGMHSTITEAGDQLRHDDYIYIGDCQTLKEVGEKLIKVLSRKDFFGIREDYTKDTVFEEIEELPVEQQTSEYEINSDNEDDVDDEDYEDEDEEIEPSQNEENQEEINSEPEYIKTSPEEIVKLLDREILKSDKLRAKEKFIYKIKPDYELDGYYYYVAIDYDDTSFDQSMYLYRTRINKIDKFMKVFAEEGYEPLEEDILYNYEEISYSTLNCNSVGDIAKVIDNMISDVFSSNYTFDMQNRSYVYKDYSVKEILSNLFKEDLMNNNLYVDGESLKSVKPDWRKRTRRIDFRLDRDTGILSGDIYVLGGFKRDDKIVHTENYDLSSFTEMEKVRYFIGDNMRNLTLYD